MKILRAVTTLTICLVLLYASYACAQQYYGKIGTGVSMNQWTKTFVDLMKLSRPFQNLDGDAQAEMDSLGYPLEDCRILVSESWPVAEWQNDIDDPEEFRPDFSGIYHCSFVGQGDVRRVWGDFTLQNLEYDAEQNRTTYELVIGEPRGGNAYGFIQLEFSNTRRTRDHELNTGFTDLRVIRPGYDLDTEQIITNEYITCINSAEFSTLRFMGWTHTNNGAGENDPNNPDYPEQLNWEDRRQLNAATYQRNNVISAEHGGPWETVIEVANIVDKDVWINVPVTASEDYIRELASLFNENLRDDLNIYVELSNEVWNRGFKQAQWCIDYGEDNGLGGFNGYADEAYAHLTANIALIFEDVFGEGSLNNRIKVMNCWQIGAWQPDEHFINQLDYVRSNFREPNTMIYGIAVAPYFGAGGALLNGSVEEIHDEMWVSSDNSRDRRRNISRVAIDFELPGGLMTYEGGSDTGGGNPQNIANRILAERDSTMRDIMIHDLRDNWFPLGGELFMYLEMAGSYSRYGSWGLTDDIDNPDRNFKFDAVRKLIGDAPENIVPSEENYPYGFVLLGVFPNPFNSELKVEFRVDSYSKVRIDLIDVRGGIVLGSQHTDYYLPGVKLLSLQLNQIPSGIYYTRITVDNKTIVVPACLCR
ncbi:MAG: T9SS type A sorting domain-containing protein [Calditrichaeota bacterium]|nr:T9SS type A sorting domain-containing protein [Calditrichota bacterium]